MIDELLSRIPNRVTFVVGKGGVGKTTTAGALALACSDRDETTHLISTDPAHSVGDLFEQDLSSGKPAASSCNRALTLEEFDARSYADALFARLRTPLMELLEGGTYLDAADAASFLDLSIPGIDEVMAALRLVELYETDVARIVVDTAPTGHTIRLLESARIIESWIGAGRAMAKKASVVASHMVGQSVRLHAESALDEWSEAAQRFERDVLRGGTAVVVTRSGSVVGAETDRLIRALESRGLAVAASVGIGTGTKTDFAVARYAGARGCEGLRNWPRHLGKAALAQPQSRAHQESEPPQHSHRNFPDDLTASLIWVAGKGGVGKSTCAAAIAAVLAESRRVCLVSTDPAGSLGDVLAVPVGGEATEIAPNFYARQIDAVAEFERMRDAYKDSIDRVFASIGLEVSASLDQKVLESLWDFAPPGIDEVIALVEIMEQRTDYGTLVIDSAPTGHFLRLLQMPEIALDWVHALLRLLVKYGAVASLDALAQDLLALAKRLRQLKLDLSTPDATAVFVVTLDEPLVKAETARLLSDLERAGIPVAATILNRADDGLPEQHAPARVQSRWRISAPDIRHEIVGLASLRAFLAEWRLTGE